MRDYAVRAIVAGGKIRALAAVTREIVEEARQRHNTAPVATAALGRLLTAGALLGLTLKGEDRLTIRLQGDGPLGKLVVDANSLGQVRGYVENNQVYLPLTPEGKLPVGEAVGREGFIYLTKDLGLKEPYTGSSALVSGEIAEDLANYFISSEQLPSAVSLGVLVDKEEWVLQAGGFVIQIFPGVDEETIDQLENALRNIPPISSILERGATPENILESIFQGMEIEFLEKQELEFQCSCSLERIEGILLSLGEPELRDILKEQGKIEMKCHFCNQLYTLSPEQIEDLLSSSK